MLEFPFAAQVGLACIEWTHDLYGADVTPMATDAGIAAIRGLGRAKRRQGALDLRRLFHGSAAVAGQRGRTGGTPGRPSMISMRRGQKLGIRRMVVPFVDASRIETDAELASVAEVFRRAMPVAEETGVEIHLETSLDPPALPSCWRGAAPHA